MSLEEIEATLIPFLGNYGTWPRLRSKNHEYI